MYSATQKVVRWPKVKCPKCGCKYSHFQGGMLETNRMKNTRTSRKWLKCIECGCEYVLRCPEGIVREGDK